MRHSAVCSTEPRRCPNAAKSGADVGELRYVRAHARPVPLSLAGVMGSWQAALLAAICPRRDGVSAQGSGTRDLEQSIASLSTHMRLQVRSVHATD